MMQQALQKLRHEMGATPKEEFIQAIGGFLINHVRSNPDHAEKIMTEGKTITGSLDAMAGEAKKRATKGRFMMSDTEGFAIVLRYYGVHIPEAAPAMVPVEEPKITVSLDDLF